MASLCGKEAARKEHRKESLQDAIRYDMALHAYMLIQSGIPVIYSGDEIGQENNYTYRDHPFKWEDSRYLHRAVFSWSVAKECNDGESISSHFFRSLRNLSDIWKHYTVFNTDVDVRTIETEDISVLGIIRENQQEKMIALFNFSEYSKELKLDELDGSFVDLISNESNNFKKADLKPFGAKWFWKKVSN